MDDYSGNLTKQEMNELISMRNNLKQSINSQYRRILEAEEYIENNGIQQMIGRYIDQYFKVHPNKSQPLSCSDPVSKELERLADYILFAPDAKPLTRKFKYNLYSRNKLEERVKKESHLDEIIDNMKADNNGYEDEEIIDFLIREGQNYKNKIEQKLFARDFVDEEMIVGNQDKNIIQEYQDFIDMLGVQCKAIADKQANNTNNKFDVKKMQAEKSKLIRHMQYCRTDQIYSKDALKGTIYFKSVLPDQGTVDYDAVDIFDKTHVMALMRMPKRNLTTDLGIVIQDFHDLIDSVEMNSLDNNILLLYRDVDMTGEDIADCLGIKREFVIATINKIANRVMAEYEARYEDWYYLNLVKGKYKKCNRCGEIKLANDRYFGKHTSMSDGMNTICRKCRKMIKS